MDHWIVREVQSGVYTQHVPLLYHDVVVDVGAHIGSFAIMAAPYASTVYAFEPHPENYRLLLSNLATSKAFTVLPYNMALSDRIGYASLNLDPWNTGGHALGPLRNDNTASIQVQVTTLDSIVKRADFLKIDAEGSELEVLKGARHLLENSRLRIAAEIHGSGLLSACTALLQSLGYTVISEPYALGFGQSFLWAWKQ